MNNIKNNKLYKIKDFLILWGSQSISQLGSSITAFALTLWLYEKTGSSLSTVGLTICSYAPYVIMSIFAGALTDRFDKKKTMLACDMFAVWSTNDYQKISAVRLQRIADLFYNTVHTVNAKDYTKEQLNVWATGQVDLEQWNKSPQKHFSIVALMMKSL